MRARENSHRPELNLRRAFAGADIHRACVASPSCSPVPRAFPLVLSGITWGQPSSAFRQLTARIPKYSRIREHFISNAYSRNMTSLVSKVVRHPPNREGEG